MKIKTYYLTFNRKPLDLTLTPPNQRGYCFTCDLEKEIRVISERFYPYEERKFCGSCALNNLYELEESNCKIENKAQVIKEIKSFLLEDQIPSEKEELLECYG